jgi:hypothetical protein
MPRRHGNDAAGPANHRGAGLRPRQREGRGGAWHTRFALLTALGATFGLWIAYVVATDQPLDFWVYYLSGAAAGRGLSPYEVSKAAWGLFASELHVSHWAWPYRYPPYTEALFAVLRPVDRNVLLVLWLTLNATAMVAATWLVGLALGGGRRIDLALACLLLCTPAYDTLFVGQINGLLFLALALAFWGLARGRDGALGAGIAVAAAIKVTPLALLAWLVWRRRWPAVWAALATFVALSLLSLPVVGPGEFVRYAQHAVDLGRPESVITGVTNVTVTGLVGRALPAAHTLDLAAGRVAAAVLVLASIVLCWPPSWGDRSRWSVSSQTTVEARTAPLEFALIVAVLPLLPPFTWFHQLVLCLIPLLVAVDRLREGEERRLLMGGGALSPLADLFWLAWMLRDAVPPWLLTWLAAGAPAYCLALWAVVGNLLLSDRRRRTALAGERDAGWHDVGPGESATS